MVLHLQFHHLPHFLLPWTILQLVGALPLLRATILPLALPVVVSYEAPVTGVCSQGGGDRGFIDAHSEEFNSLHFPRLVTLVSLATRHLPG